MNTKKNTKRALPLLFLTGLLTLAASAGARPARVHVGIRVGGPPPVALREVVGARPGRHFVWVPGHWDWVGPRRGYVWVRGAWLRPPRARAVWVAPRWERRGRETLFFGGYWRF